MTDAPHPLDAKALAKMLFGTDDTELMATQQLLDYKVIQLALAQARRETWEAAAKELSKRYKDTEYNIQTELFIDWCRQQAKENP